MVMHGYTESPVATELTQADAIWRGSRSSDPDFLKSIGDALDVSTDGKRLMSMPANFAPARSSRLPRNWRTSDMRRRRKIAKRIPYACRW